MKDKKQWVAMAAAIACYLQEEGKAIPTLSPWVLSHRQQMGQRRHPQPWRRTGGEYGAKKPG